MRPPHEDAWTIRLARKADAEAMPAIERAAGTMFARIEALAEIAGQHTVPLDRLLRYIARGHCLVAVHEGALIGFIVTEPFGRELHVWEFNVHPDWQGRGIGAALLRGCMIDAGNSGFTALTLTTFDEVPWNAPFYRRLGFADLDADAHPRLAEELAKEYGHGMPTGSRVAMIRELP
ncbi:GNAT family N-acetyltransferase [Citromicrobium bathyomarinum]|mgnify:FL=1|uniref:GNAT family N-acetyltransferase n=1 Tax=Citromicrobium bathyomarinum TaxID=72174 RepID=UPI00315A022B